MDVTFFEEQPFYPKTDVQGENCIEEHLFWSYPNFSSPPSQLVPTTSPPDHLVPIDSSPSHPVPTTNPPSHLVPTDSPSSPVHSPRSPPSPIQETAQGKTKEILVDSRRQKTQKEIEDHTLSQQCQDTDLGSQPLVTHAGSAPPNLVPFNLFNDLDQPH